MGKLHRKPQNSLNQETRDKIYSAINPKQDYTPLLWQPSSLHSATNSVHNNNINNPGKLVPELSETLTQYATLTVLKFLTSTPAFLPRPPSLPLKFNIKENPGKQLKKHEETEDKNTHFFYTCLILDLPWLTAGSQTCTNAHQNIKIQHYITWPLLTYSDKTI